MDRIKKTPKIFSFVSTVAVVGAALATSANAGDNNTLYLIQDSLGSLEGNSLLLDQSLARNSQVAGNIDGLTPATQLGGGNLADVIVEQGGAIITLNQDSSLAQILTGNTATIFGGELATIALKQLGGGNLGEIKVSGSMSSGSLFQNGDDNLGSVLVSGNNASGTLNQTGDRNSYSLSVSGDSANVTYNQIGNDLGSSGAGASVFTTATAVVITQTSF